MTRKTPDLSMKSHVRQRDSERNLEFFGNPVPSVQACLNLMRVVISQSSVDRRQSPRLPCHDLSAGDFLNGIRVAAKRVVVADIGFAIAALQSACVVASGVGGNLGTKQVQ